VINEMIDVPRLAEGRDHVCHFIFLEESVGVARHRIRISENVTRIAFATVEE
jgi:hypothetical protein